MNNLFGQVQVSPLQSGDDMVLNGSLNYVHRDWLPDVRNRIRTKHQNEDNFVIKYALDWEDVDKFTHGKLLATETFKYICTLLNFDWQQIQKPVQEVV